VHIGTVCDAQSSDAGTQLLIDTTTYCYAVLHCTEPARAIAVGYSHTCVLRAGGSVVCFGFNSYGQLGINSTAKYVHMLTYAFCTLLVLVLLLLQYYYYCTL
jgi:alpha-tubulin suppressor-like RCC1 family protein